MCLFLHVEAEGYPPCHTRGHHLPLLEHLSLNLEPSKSAGLTSLDPPIPDFLALELKTYATVSRLFLWVLGINLQHPDFYVGSGGQIHSGSHACAGISPTY